MGSRNGGLPFGGFRAKECLQRIALELVERRCIWAA